ncbi:peroxisomal multifunctional enzyme type 2 isoform X2 [Eurytemora carolleeae]|nr:peroxisomal multifunctional enzyme type 2 isoform X2 [Eurytemora carolleeae]|eukprot:XP_023321911.1 peroxisomal multifunctional enzyme type 2-like isoform X2 [Eurytemora affinis]
MSVRFDGRVALVTGAGGGLGRSYALLLAQRGAKVVVNDLGGSKSGGGGDSRAADLVVQEIRASGGEAVPNYDSVEEGEKLVQSALNVYGRIDIVINNAGILRDKSFARLSEQDWDLVHRVHLRGAFKVSQAAWPHMKKINFGRIIMTSSVAGIFGNFGQANYSAAKLGLVGLSNTLAEEGARFGIHSNVIIPMAASRLTQDILPPEVFDALSPDHIAPIVAWLCHEDCEENGSIVEAAGGWAGRYRWQRSKGIVLTDQRTKMVSLENVKDGWEKVIDMSEHEYPDSTQGATMDVVARIQESMSSDPGHSSDEVSPLSAVGYTSKPVPFSYNFKDLIIYALGVGVSTKDKHGLRYLYENDEMFSALPTFGVIPAMSGLEDLVSGNIPGLDFHLANVLHGEQYMEILKPIPTSGRLENIFRIQDVLDKGSGMVLLIEVETRDENNELLMRNQNSIFVKGSGGFNGPRNSKHLTPVSTPPSRSPDKTLKHKTTVDQAALYRLSGDLNPLHIDPAFSAIGGFSSPILHGLCTYGIAVRHVIDGFCAGDPGAVREIKARFSKPVLPGQTVITEMWKDADKVLFSCQVQETGEKCLTGGWIRIQGFNNSKL